jgi:signal transduction histidine kinase
MEIAWQRDQALSRVIQEKTPIQFEEVTRDGHGKELVFQRRLVPIFDSRGEVELILGTGTDITRITRHREELETRVAERTAELIGALEKERELGEMKMQFVSMASHEFRTPLATITTSSDILLHYRDRLSPEQIDKNLRKIQEELRLLTGLLEDFLSYGKAESGHMQFHPTRVGLHALLREEVFARLTESNRARVRVRSVPDDFEMRVDRTLFRQVLSNLIENALKYSANDAVVRVIAVRTKEGTRVRIRDFGIGIPPGDLSGIFEPFVRGGNVGSRSGTGLGLAITRMALELHGGEIAAHGELDKGTMFEIRLPHQ